MPTSARKKNGSMWASPFAWPRLVMAAIRTQSVHKCTGHGEPQRVDVGIDPYAFVYI